MKKELKDYAHLYIGCKIDFLDESGDIQTGILKGIDGKLLIISYKGWEYRTKGDYEELKLHLRPLSEMTESEFYEFKKLADNDSLEFVLIKNVTETQTRLLYQFEAVRFLLSKYFDLFGLIEAGLAIDASTSKEKS